MVLFDKVFSLTILLGLLSIVLFGLLCNILWQLLHFLSLKHYQLPAIFIKPCCHVLGLIATFPWLFAMLWLNFMVWSSSPILGTRFSGLETLSQIQ